MIAPISIAAPVSTALSEVGAVAIAPLHEDLVLALPNAAAWPLG
jgi:hypothetical protein